MRTTNQQTERFTVEFTQGEFSYSETHLTAKMTDAVKVALGSFIKFSIIQNLISSTAKKGDVQVRANFSQPFIFRLVAEDDGYTIHEKVLKLSVPKTQKGFEAVSKKLLQSIAVSMVDSSDTSNLFRIQQGLPPVTKEGAEYMLL